MKIKLFIFLCAIGMILSSCNSTTFRKYPEELAVPVIKALQGGSVNDLCCLIPMDKDIVTLTNQNQGIFGAQYYNKYAETYNKKNLIAKMTSAVETSDYIAKQNSLDWQNVKIGSITPEEVTTEDAQYNKVTVDLKFGKEEYQVVYNAVKSPNNGWFLGNDVYLMKKPAQ